MKENYGIKSWAIDDRPREKLLMKGPSSLSDAELLAIIFGNGTKEKSAVDLARELLKNAQGDLDRLARMTLKDFQKIKGVGPAKAVALMACLELGRRRKVVNSEQKFVIRSSRDVFEMLVGELRDLVHEVFYVLYLSQRNHVIFQEVLSIGGLTGTVVDVRLIAKNALDHRACNVIVSHNHPSHNLTPSQADIQLTHQIKEALQLFNIKLFDHIIIGGNNYYSFADEGLI